MAEPLSLFLQNELFTRFLLPFLLVFLITFAILEKTAVLGTGNKQLNAIISFVIGFIFVGVAQPVLMINNLMLFLVVGIIIIFVTLMIWGFVSGQTNFSIITTSPWAKAIVFGLLVLGIIYATLWAGGVKINEMIFTPLFRQPGSESLWSNIGFVVIIALALALVLKNTVATVTK